MLKRIIAEERAADGCQQAKKEKADFLRGKDPHGLDPQEEGVLSGLEKAVREKCKSDMKEGIENITPENIGIAIDALMKMKYLLLPILGTAGVTALMDFLKSRESGESSDDSMLNRDI